MQTKTPTTHPRHGLVGHYFIDPIRQIHYCDSFNLSLGFGMTNLSTPGFRVFAQAKDFSFDGTYHRINQHGRYRFGNVLDKELQLIEFHQAAIQYTPFFPADLIKLT